MQPIPPLPTPEEVLSLVEGLAGIPAVLVACTCAAIVVAARDWRVVLASFMSLYVALALLSATVQPPDWALLRVITGGLVAVMWYLSAQRSGWGGRFLPFSGGSGTEARPVSSTTVFRLLATISLAGVLLATRSRLPLPPVPPDFRLVATWLVAYAFLGLALGDEPLQTGTALLMWLAATQLVMIALVQNTWLIWLLSTVEFLVGLATAYLMVTRGTAFVAHLDKDTA